MSVFNGIAMGMFASPNRAGVMNSLPVADRGAGGGMNQTFQNSAQVLSIGIFFTLMIVGLSSSLPYDMLTGLQAHGVPHAEAAKAANLPAISIVFAAFLGYNPIQHLVGGSVLGKLPGPPAPGPHRSVVLPASDLRVVHHGPARSFPVRDRRVPDRGRGLLVTRCQPGKRGLRIEARVRRPGAVARRWRWARARPRLTASSTTIIGASDSAPSTGCLIRALSLLGLCGGLRCTIVSQCCWHWRFSVLWSSGPRFAAC